MKIKVISLKSSSERRNNISRQFDQLDTPFDFFNAVTPLEASEHVDNYDRREFLRNCGRYATATEIACYASHRALWRQCAAADTPFLILEDDAQLDDSFLTGLLVAASQINKLGLIRVSLPRLTSSLPVDHLGPFDVRYCQRVPLLALGYAMSPLAAARLADAAATVEEPVDKFMQRFWRHGQPVFAITPPFVTLASVASESDIGERTCQRPGLSVWMQRAFRKMQNSVLRTVYNFNFVQRALRGNASI